MQIRKSAAGNVVVGTRLRFTNEILVTGISDVLMVSRKHFESMGYVSACYKFLLCISSSIQYRFYVIPMKHFESIG